MTTNRANKQSAETYMVRCGDLVEYFLFAALVARPGSVPDVPPSPVDGRSAAARGRPVDLDGAKGICNTDSSLSKNHKPTFALSIEIKQLKTNSNKVTKSLQL
jgi:hypothetical protein